MKNNGIDITKAYHNGIEITSIMLNGVDVGAFTPPTPPEPDYQPWESYPDSPFLTETYPYQFIVSASGSVFLALSASEFYIEGDTIKNVGGTYYYSYINNGEWLPAPPNTPLSTTGFGLSWKTWIEANNDVYTDATLTSIYFAKTTA